MAPVALKAPIDAANQRRIANELKSKFQHGNESSDPDGEVAGKLDQYLQNTVEAATQIRWGLIDTSGTTIVPSQYIKMQRHSAGIYDVVTDSGIGYIDRTGKKIFEPKR